MTVAAEHPRLCVCDGRYDGCAHDDPCGMRAVSPERWGPWCADCNSRRIAHIDWVLNDILGATPEEEE